MEYRGTQGNIKVPRMTKKIESITRQVTLNPPACPILPLDALRTRPAELPDAEPRLEVDDARL